MGFDYKKQLLKIEQKVMNAGKDYLALMLFA